MTHLDGSLRKAHANSEIKTIKSIELKCTDP